MQLCPRPPIDPNGLEGATPSGRRWSLLRDTALVAVAYLAAAGLGKLLAAPPNNTMLLWPAAAVGLVAMARGGARLLPGVGLGGALYTLLRLGHDGHLTLEELIGAAENAAVSAAICACIFQFTHTHAVEFTNKKTWFALQSPA